MIETLKYRLASKRILFIFIRLIITRVGFFVIFLQLEIDDLHEKFVLCIFFIKPFFESYRLIIFAVRFSHEISQPNIY